MTVQSVNNTVEDRGLGVVEIGAQETCLVIGTSSSGTALEPHAYGGGSDGIRSLLATEGHGSGPELCAQILATGANVVFCKVTSATNPGVVGAPLKTNAIATMGTSAITITGTPYDTYDLVWTCTTGATIGVTGGKFTYSLDGGQNTSGIISLGTAATFPIPNSGITLAFAAGTIVTGDVVTAHTIEPQPTSADVALAYAAAAAGALKWDYAHVQGETTATEAGVHKTALTLLETNHNPTSELTSTRYRYPDAHLTGSPADVDFDGTAHTIARATGSFVTDGFKVGMVPTVAGTTLNNGVLPPITVVAAALLTFGSGIVTEPNQVAPTITAVEPEATWIAAIQLDYDGFVCDRMGVSSDVGYLDSAIVTHNPARRLIRPASWAAACMGARFDVHKSLSRVKSGSTGMVITGSKREYLFHNERIVPGLDDSRFITLCTYNRKKGVFITKARLMADVGSDFIYWQYRRVMDVCCKTSFDVLVEELGDDVRVDKTTGFILEADALAIEAAVNEALKTALLDRGRASFARFVLSRTDNILSTRTLNYTTSVVPKGYIDRINGTSGFTNPALRITEV